MRPGQGPASRRHDHGSQFSSEVYQGDLRFFGIESSPAFVRQPEGNGCAERLVRTLKEQVLWLRRFTTIAELRMELQAFRIRYNANWLLGRYAYRSPATVRAAFGTAQAEVAA